jgi:cysteinyl-tRNA synthetase
MAKSAGNFVTIRDLLSDWPGEVIRFNMLRTHYRQPLDWTVRGLDESRSALRTLTDFAEFSDDGDETVVTAVLEALTDDLNTPQAIAELHALHKKRAWPELASSVRALGLRRPKNLISVDAGKVDGLIGARNAARQARDFKKADAIRDELAKMGVVLKDGPQGTTWEVAR